MKARIRLPHHVRFAVLGFVCVLAAAACSGASPQTPPTTPVSGERTTSTAPTTTPAPPSSSTTSTLAPFSPDRTVALPRLDVWLFPGPQHFAGDHVTFEVPLEGFGVNQLESASLRVDDEVIDVPGQIFGDPLLGDRLIFANAFDTTGQVGGHWVEIDATLTSNSTIDILQRFVVLPDSRRPQQEVAAEWLRAPTDCCTLVYLEGTAAARDLEALVAMVDESTAEVEEHFGVDVPPVDIVLIDKLWGNGGYAGSELVLSYLDRDFSPGRLATFRQTVLHELAHAATDQLEVSTPWPMIEAVAVQFTGGHFKQESLAGRAKALRDVGELPSLPALFDDFPTLQHESRYAAVGAFAQFVSDTHGEEALLELFSADVRATTSGGWLAAAARRSLDVGIEELQRQFDSWLDGHDAAGEALDLELTVTLQDARRRFQARFDPYPNYFHYPSITHASQTSLASRDATHPAVVAVEALIAYGQDLIIGGHLEDAAVVVAEVATIVESGVVGGELAGEFLAVARALDNAGLELIEYVPGSAAPQALAARHAPELVVASLIQDDRGWRVSAIESAPEGTTAFDIAGWFSR